MDPNAPTPPEAPAPTPTPSGPPPHKGLSKKTSSAIVGGVLLALILLVFGIALANDITKSQNDKTDNHGAHSLKDHTTNGETTPTNPEVEPITAKDLIELRAACIGGSVENAAAFTKPYRYVAYEDNNYGTTIKPAWDWDMYATSDIDEGTPAERSVTVEETNVVACLERDDSTAVKTMECELYRGIGMDSSESTVADYFSVKYKMTLYEARSGKVITEPTYINGPATECPDTFYSKADPNIYGDPDFSEIQRELKALEQ